ncbi:MAG: capsule biosynthesis GfcC family protein [Pseudomonadaceae bacterium]
MKRLTCSLALLASTLISNPLLASDLVVTGQVSVPGSFLWHQGARLLDLTTAAQVDTSSWPLGAALLRQSAKHEQRKLKAGVLFDLRAARVNAAALGDDSLTELLAALQQQVAQMPVTGRVPAEMNPLKQRLAKFNPLLEPGDQLVYPGNPHTIRIVGAVNAPCDLEFIPAQSPKRYLDSCSQHWIANPDEIYLIQPNGDTSRLGIAPWNSEDAWLAEGGTIYVPLRHALFGESGNDFNNEMAALLATQYIGVEATSAHE